MRAVANAAGAGAALVTGPLLARGLGVDGRGEFAAIIAPVLLASVLLAGAGEVMAADIASKRRTAAEVFLPSLLIAAVFAAILVAAIVLLAPFLLGGHERARATLTLLSLCLFPVALQCTARALRQGERSYGRVTREAWVAAGLRVGLIVALFAAGALSVTSGSVATMAALILPAVILLRGLPMRWRSPTMRFWAIVRQQAGRSSRSFLGNVANQLNLRLDQTVLAGLANPRQLGLYAVAVSIAEVPGIGTSAFRQVLLPEAASRQDEGLLVARASRTVLLVTAPIIVVGLVAVGPFLGLVFGPGFADGKNMARILLVASWVGTPGGFLTTGILASGRPGLASVPAVAGLVCTGFLLPVLATRHGGIGAAWTSLAAYTAATLVSALLFRRITGHSLAAALVPRPGDARSVAGAVAARVRAARRARGAVSRSPL